MPQLDPLADAMSALANSEQLGKRELIVRPASKLIGCVLTTIKKQGYIGEIERIENRRGDLFKVALLGRINKCGVIKPRFSVKHNEIEKWEKHYLPARQFGLLVLSTPHGVISHIEAKEMNTGGRLLAYVF